MEMISADIQHKRFRTRWMGLDPREVEIFIQELAEEVRSLKAENAELRRDLQDREKDLKEYKDREKAIRNVLLSAHKTAEQMKANAEKEARLVIADAEMKAERIEQGAQRRLERIHEDIGELKRQRIQLETKLRATIETYRQLLDMDREEEKEDDAGNEDAALDR